jgi:prepilin-type N-terminal cleavage/methylation domain-containing protein
LNFSPLSPRRTNQTTRPDFLRVVRPAPPRRAAGWTLTEILVVVAVIAVLAALLAAGVHSALARARSAQCVGHLKQIGSLISMYAADNNGELPHNKADQWYLHLLRYIPGKAPTGSQFDKRARGTPFWCPANCTLPLDYKFFYNSDFGYLCNLQLMPNSASARPVKLASITTRRILAADTLKRGDGKPPFSPQKPKWVYFPNSSAARGKPMSSLADDDPQWNIHGQGIHALWTDFSVSWMPQEEANRAGASLPGGFSHFWK